MVAGDTKERIMAAARLTVQDRGYSGLSFRELAKDVGVKSASIHYYFPTKGDWAARWRTAIHRTSPHIWTVCWPTASIPRPAWRAYADVFRDTLRNDNRMCLAGIMAAEHRNCRTKCGTKS